MLTPSPVPPTRTHCPKRTELIDGILARADRYDAAAREASAFWRALRRTHATPAQEIRECRECGDAFMIHASAIRYRNAGRFHSKPCASAFANRVHWGRG